MPTDIDVRDVPYVVQRPGKQGKSIRERGVVRVEIPVLHGFDERDVATTADGAMVDLGRGGGTTYVRVPWETAVGRQGQVRSTDGEGMVQAMERDPTSAATRQGRVFRADDTEVTFTDSPDDATGIYDSDQAHDHVRRNVTSWLGRGASVEGALYVPTTGVSVHVVIGPRARPVPALEFGWSGLRRTACMVDGWAPGWEPFGGWDVGELEVPEAFLVDPAAAQLARALSAMFTHPDWGARHRDGGWRGLRTVHDTGDVAAVAAHLAPHANKAWGEVGLHLTRTVEAMTPDVRERFEALVEGADVRPPAPRATFHAGGRHRCDPCAKPHADTGTSDDLFGVDHTAKPDRTVSGHTVVLKDVFRMRTVRIWKPRGTNRPCGRPGSQRPPRRGFARRS